MRVIEEYPTGRLYASTAEGGNGSKVYHLSSFTRYRDPRPHWGLAMRLAIRGWRWLLEYTTPLDFAQEVSLVLCEVQLPAGKLDRPTIKVLSRAVDAGMHRLARREGFTRPQKTWCRIGAIPNSNPPVSQPTVDPRNCARWGDYATRRNKAREMRAAGATLKQIAEACGYRSIASAHYATA